MEPSRKTGLGRRPAIAHPQRDRAHARPAILGAARRLFKSERYDMISEERIAANAGVTRHTLKNHFSCKAEIFRECREQLLSELDGRIDDEIPRGMETFDGILYFLESCHEILSDQRNLEVVRSIADDGAIHAWLGAAHQRRVRMRLVRNCETYILYKSNRTDIPLLNPCMIAEHLVILVEAMVFGPYLNGNRQASQAESLRHHFTIAAMTYASMIDGDCFNEKVMSSKIVAAA